VATTPALGARLWTLVASPLTMTAGQRTDVDVTSTNLGGLLPGELIGCVTVLVPSSTTVERVWDEDKPGGYDWEASSAAAAGGTLVTYRSISGKLGLLQSATFRARVTPTAAGTQIWQGTAYDAATCDAGVFPQINLVFTISLPALPSPTPVTSPSPGPTPMASSTPTASPTPSPTASPSLPTGPPATPTPGPSATPPSTAGPALSPATADTPQPSIATTRASTAGSGDPPTDPGQAGARPGAGAGGLTSSSGDGSVGGGGQDRLDVSGRGAAATLPDGLELTASGMGGVGLFLWAVPAAALGIPGFLVVLVVLLQAGGGLIWLPLARRRIGGFGRTSKPRVR
jgi:hypothetical protein